MKLRELDPFFFRYEERPRDAEGMALNPPGSPGYCATDTFHVGVDSITEADAIQFLCPVCFVKNGGPVRTHSVICNRPRVPLVPGKYVGPGRWEFQGSGYDDLTLVAGSSSILLEGGCRAHFFIQQGEIR